ncbi:hypothetical protein PMJ11TS3_09300 [Paenibacillus melissococcoides]
MSSVSFDNYDDYVKLASQLTTPLLIKPGGLPDGYVFSKAEVGRDCEILRGCH